MLLCFSFMKIESCYLVRGLFPKSRENALYSTDYDY